MPDSRLVDLSKPPEVSVTYQIPCSLCGKHVGELKLSGIQGVEGRIDRPIIPWAECGDHA